MAIPLMTFQDSPVPMISETATKCQVEPAGRKYKVNDNYLNLSLKLVSHHTVHIERG